MFDASRQVAVYSVSRIGLWLLCTSIGFVAPANALENLSNAAWTLEQISDPVHRGGTILNAQYFTREGGDERVAQVRCWTATALLDVRFQPGRQAAELSGEVTWRFDRGPVGKARWRVNPMGNAIVVPDALQRSFVRSMRAARSLELHMKKGADADLQFIVPLRGSSMPIGKVAAACGS